MAPICAVAAKAEEPAALLERFPVDELPPRAELLLPLPGLLPDVAVPLPAELPPPVDLAPAV